MLIVFFIITRKLTSLATSSTQFALFAITFFCFLLLCISVAVAVSITIILSRVKEREHNNKVRIRESSLKGVIIVASIADAQIIDFFVWLICFSPVVNTESVPLYLKISCILIGVLLELLLIGLMTQWLTGKRFIVWGCCAALPVIILMAGHFGPLIPILFSQQNLKDITMPESFNYMDYIPFTSGNKVKTLDEKATLHFDDIESIPILDGATALYPMYSAFAQATYPDSMAKMQFTSIYHSIKCSTTPSAYKNIVDKKCDIIFVGGPSEDQEKYAEDNGVELVYTPIGKEAFVFFVNPNNPIEGLTLQEIRDIYSGKITKWDQLGVENLGDILAYQRDEGSGSQTALERFVMKDTPLMPAAKETVIQGMGDIVIKVSSYKNLENALGYSFRFYCTALMKGFDVKLLSVNGVAPTVENIENGTYPLASYFYAVTRSDADENTLALVDWICGPQGQALVEKCGYTPVGAGE